MNENIILDKSKALALRIIKLYQFLCETKKEYVLSKQVLRSGTSIGANAQSKADLLHKSWYMEKYAFDSIYSDCKEIIKILASITKTQKQ